MAGIVDADRDGVPDLYDGMPLAPALEDLPAQEREKHTSAAWLSKAIPLAVRFDADPGEEAYLTFHYPDADPLTTGAQGTFDGYVYTGAGTSQQEGPTVRLWAEGPGIPMTSNPYPFTERVDSNNPDELHHPGGNYVVPTRRLLVSKFFGLNRIGVRHLYIQPIRGGTEALSIVVQLHRPSGSCNEAIAHFTSIELRPVDGQHLRPVFYPKSGAEYGVGSLALSAQLATTASDEQLVGGAIIDGASLVAMHLLAPDDFLSEAANLSLRIDPSDVTIPTSGIPEADGEVANPRLCDAPVLFGGFSPTHFRGRASVPALPMPPEVDRCFIEPCYSREISLNRQAGLVYYVPPRNSVGPVGEFCSPSPSLPRRILQPNQEIGTMMLRLVWRSSDAEPPVRVLAEQPFFLRRPPLVLIHGIRVASTSWKTGNTYWDEGNSTLATRLYFADYGSTRLKGYPENLPSLGKAIERALRQYRSGGRDRGPPATSRERHISERGFFGIKYAATRVNLVGHSMGGQIGRLYLSDLNFTSSGPRVHYTVDPLFGISSQGYGVLAVNRPSTTGFEVSGNNRYFRSNNLGAGDVNRFVPVGSPFKGSPLAIASTKLFDPNGALVRGSLAYVNAPTGFDNERYINLLTAITLTGFSDPLFEVEIRNAQQVCTFTTATGNADLVEGSPMQRMLEKSSYPIANKAVPWMPIVGIAIPPEQLPNVADWEALNEEYLSSYRDRDAAFHLLTVLSTENTPELEQYRVLFSNALSFLLGGRGAPGSARFSIWNSDLVVNGHSQRNAQGPQPSGFWGVRDPGDLLFLNGTGMNGTVGNRPGIGARVFGHVHSDSMFDSSTIFQSGQGYTPWRRMKMEQESTAVVNKVGSFLNNTYDMTPNGAFGTAGESFVIDLSADAGHSLGNR